MPILHHSCSIWYIYICICIYIYIYIYYVVYYYIFTRNSLQLPTVSMSGSESVCVLSTLLLTSAPGSFWPYVPNTCANLSGSESKRMGRRVAQKGWDCMYVCMYVCMCVYIYIYIYIYILSGMYVYRMVQQCMWM